MKKIKVSLAILTMTILVSCGGKSEGDFSKPSAEEVEAAIENAGKEAETSEVVAEETPAVELSEEEALIEAGKKIFEGKGTCMACHQPEIKVIGPSIKDIAKIYKDKNADIVKFLKGEGEAIVDPSQFEVMKANFAITKQMSDEELLALESYIYSFQ